MANTKNTELLITWTEMSISDCALFKMETLIEKTMWLFFQLLAVVVSAVDFPFLMIFFAIYIPCLASANDILGTINASDNCPNNT